MHAFSCSCRNLLASAAIYYTLSFVDKMATQKCLLPTCNKSGKLNTFKLQAVKKPIECAVERHDYEIRDKL